MSWEALDWAGKQRTRACSTQVVLYVLANASDPDGVAMGWWTRDEHWWQYLIDRTRLKRASLFRIIGELKDAGALTLEWREPADGGRKRAIVRLNLACHINEDASEGESTMETPAAPQAPIAQAVESTTEITSGKPVHHVDPIESTSETCSYTNPKKTPEAPKPPSGAFVPKIDEEAEKRFREFRASYPDGIPDHERAHREFIALSEADQVEAIDKLAHYGAYLRKRKQNSVKGHLYLKKRMWEGVAGVAAEAGARWMHERGSREARAITVLHRIAGSVPPLDVGGRISSSCKITPKLLALADAPHHREWITGHQGAWREFIDDTLPATVGRGKLAVILAPWEFPPRVDGTLSSTDPPRELLTESDVKFMADGF